MLMLTVRAWLARTGETAFYSHGLGRRSIRASQQVLADRYDVNGLRKVSQVRRGRISFEEDWFRTGYPDELRRLFN